MVDSPLPCLRRRRLPSEEDELDHNIRSDWLEAVLRKHYSRPGYCSYISINSFTTSAGCMLKDPVVSDIMAVTIDATVNNTQVTHNLILKLLPLDKFSRRALVFAQLDRREVMFYTRVVPDIDDFQRRIMPDPDDHVILPLAQCYFAKYAPPKPPSPGIPFTSTDYSILVLENLKYLDFVNVNNLNGLRTSQVESAVEALSRVHALTLSMKVKSGLKLTERYDFLYPIREIIKFYERIFLNGYPRFMGFLRSQSGMQSIIRRVEEIRPHARAFIAALIQPEDDLSVLTHTDFWASNLLFRGRECVILDWQMISCGRGTHDLAFLISTSTSACLRRTYSKHFVNLYWSSLVRHAMTVGVSIEEDVGYTRDQVREDFRTSQLLAFFLLVGAIDMIIGVPENESRFLEFVKDLAQDEVLSIDTLAQLTEIDV